MKENTKSHNRGGRGKPRPLTGKKLVDAAHVVLGGWAILPPKSHPITVSRLAEALNVGRQAIYNHEEEIGISKYVTLQKENLSKSEDVIIRRPLEERIDSQEKTLAEFRRKLDGWIEWWTKIEYNAKMLGIDADKILLAPMPLPGREGLCAVRGRKYGDDDDE